MGSIDPSKDGGQSGPFQAKLHLALLHLHQPSWSWVPTEQTTVMEATAVLQVQKALNFSAVKQLHFAPALRVTQSMLNGQKGR